MLIGEANEELERIVPFVFPKKKRSDGELSILDSGSRKTIPIGAIQRADVLAKDIEQCLHRD